MRRIGYKLYGVWFVLRNWRYHRHHNAVLDGLRDAVRDEPPARKGTDYTVEINGPVDEAVVVWCRVASNQKGKNQ